MTMPSLRLRYGAPFAVLLAACATQAQVQADPAPACTADVGYQAVCGIAPPEDIELSSDGKQLFMSVTPGLAGQHQPRLRVMTLASHETMDLEVSFAAEEGWGDSDCPAPEQGIGAHGIHLSLRSDGREQLLVVNHSGREAIEFIEMIPGDQGWQAVWRGCVESREPGMFNDVAATPEGGFVATVMFVADGLAPPIPLEQLLDGRDTGHLMHWHVDRGLSKLPGSEAPFPNGVQVTPDGKSAWFAAWTADQIWRYDLQAGAVDARVDSGYMVDNLNWAEDGRLLGAGVPDSSTFVHCFQQQIEHCSMGVRVSALDTTSLEHEMLFSKEPGVMSGASVATQVGDDLYVGTFTGDRLLRIERGEWDGRD